MDPPNHRLLGQNRHWRVLPKRVQLVQRLKAVERREELQEGVQREVFLVVCEKWIRDAGKRQKRKVLTEQFEPKKVSMLLAASWVFGGPILVGMKWQVQMKSGLVHPKHRHPTRRMWMKTEQKRRHPRQAARVRDSDRRESRECHLTCRACRVGLGRKGKSRRLAGCP